MPSLVWVMRIWKRARGEQCSASVSKDHHHQVVRSAEFYVLRWCERLDTHATWNNVNLECVLSAGGNGEA